MIPGGIAGWTWRNTRRIGRLGKNKVIEIGIRRLDL